MKFPILDILRLQFQNFTDPYSTPCHQFKHQAVSGALRSENEFINGILLSPVNTATTSAGYEWPHNFQVLVFLRLF
jgi:hypothetical protein